MNVYDFTVKNNKGEDVSLSEYKGNVLMIVNTATKCGLTPQYDGLEALYQKYIDNGFVLLDFPSNQFLDQAPEDDEGIESFCTLNYGTTFPRFSKVNVNGEDAAPLFAWLKEQISEDIGDAESKAFEDRVGKLKPVEKDGDIKWNFLKFLIDKEGNVVARYSPAYAIDKIEKDIEELLK